MLMHKPLIRPSNPCFSSGPCAKRPGWSVEALQGVLAGRSHRSKPGKARLQEVLDLSRTLLGVPDDYRIGIVPASDTGAVEMCLWSMLGPRGVDMLTWESFGDGWVLDVVSQLKLPDVRTFRAPYGQLPDLTQVSWDRDVVFTWNGTTSGVRVPDGSWIAADRAGLSIADATSAAFAMDLPWDKLDVVTWSWQKVLGGEGAHGMLVLSPRAVERLESYTPPWPLPKLFRMTKGGKLQQGIFEAETINTPSMLAVEDAVDSLKWAAAVGGLPVLKARCLANLETIAAWVESTPWVEFLCRDKALRSPTAVCLTLHAPWFDVLDRDAQVAVSKKLAGLLDAEGVAYDIAAYKDSPPGLRIWSGATVETADVEALLPWITWAWSQVSPA